MAQRATCILTVKAGRRSRRATRFALIILSVCGELACRQKTPASLFQSAQDLYRQGRFAEATKTAETGRRTFEDRQSQWYWKFTILSAELELLNGKTGAADSLLNAIPSEQFHSLLPRYKMLRAYSLARHNRHQEAQDYFQQAIAESQTLDDNETQADAWLWSGMSRLTPNELSAAEDSFRRAEDLAGRFHLYYQKAEALNDRGLLQIKREHYADAIPLLEESRDAANRAGAGFISALALNNLALCYENLGNLDRALEAQKSSIERQEHFGLDTMLSSGYSELGSILFNQGELDAAISYFRRAMDRVSKDAPFEYSLAASNLANAYVRKGSLDEAEHFNRIAAQLADPKGTSQMTTVTSTEAAIAEQRGDHDKAIALNQKVLVLAEQTPSILWQTYARLGDSYAARGDFNNADTSYSKVISVIAANRADQLKSDYKITFLSNLIRFYQDYVELLMRHGDVERALAIADSSRASVLTEDLTGRSEASRPELIAQLRKAAQANHSVFLFYWLAPQQSYVWAINGKECKAFRLSDEKKIEQDVSAYRALIEEQKRDPLAAASPAGARLFQELIEPAAGLIQSNGRVVVVPDGALHNLNFETLLVAKPAPHYWIEDATISVAPSLSILQSGKILASKQRSLLLLGNPVTAGTGFAALPESAEEIARIRRAFPSTESRILSGAEAAAAAYFSARPERYSTIHFATHVDANAQSPLDSAIILSPQASGYRLYARDVAGTPLNADLVTLSGCHGAGARTLSGEGLVGFAWAFFQARAHNVVTSLWDVSDQSTAQLMGNFYSGVTANRPYAQALREAKLEMLKNSNYKRPYYWAPFQLYSRTLTAAQ